MMSRYPVRCPHESCGWTGKLVPSQFRGGVDAEIASTHRAWFTCPNCRRDWEVRITDDKVEVLPSAERVDRWRDTGGEA